MIQSFNTRFRLLLTLNQFVAKSFSSEQLFRKWQFLCRGAICKILTLLQIGAKLYFLKIMFNITITATIAYSWFCYNSVTYFDDVRITLNVSALELRMITVFFFFRVSLCNTSYYVITKLFQVYIHDLVLFKLSYSIILQRCFNNIRNIDYFLIRSNYVRILGKKGIVFCLFVVTYLLLSHNYVTNLFVTTT